MSVAAGTVVRKALPLLFFLSAPLFAQSGVWGSRGISHAFLVRDNLVYDVDGRGVSVYDVSNPAAIRRVAVAEEEAESLDGAFLPGGDLLVLTRQGVDRYQTDATGRLALLARYPAHGFAHLRANAAWVVTASANGVSVWQLGSDGLTQIRQLSFAKHVNAIALAGDALYVAVDQVGIQVVDASGERETSVLAENAQDLAVAGDKLTVAGGVNGLLVADIADPFAPLVVRRSGAGEMNLAHVAVAGTRIFGSDAPSTIRIFGDSGEIARIDDPVQALAADGTRLFVSGTNFDRFGLATETGAPLRVYDVSVPAAPRLAGEFRDLAGPVSGAATDGTLAYIVDRPFFRVIDVSTTSAPREIASLAIDNIEDSVKLLGKQVILYGRGDVDLVDVSNPYRPRLVKVFHSFGRPPSNAAFARDTIVEANPWSGFHVVDFVSFPEPGQIGGIKGHYYEVVGNGGDVAYIAGEAEAIGVVDLRDPRNPTVVKILHVGVRQAFIAGDNLVVRSADGLHVYSLANPFDPIETSFVPMTDAGVAGPSGDAALVWLDDALVRVDLATRETAPSGFTVLAPMQIDGTGGKSVVADRYGLRVFGPNSAPPPPPPPPRRHAARH
jgi:hypothetical protein